MKIIFTSCMDAERVPEQVIWREIERRLPDVLLLLGDQIYMDWGDLGESSLKKQYLKNKTKGLQAFAREMHRRYEKQWAVPDFQSCIRSLRSRRAPLFVCWDDHDFAWNNSFRQGAADEKHAVPTAIRHVSQRLFKQFEQHLQLNFAQDVYPDLPDNWGESLADDHSEVDQVKRLSSGADAGKPTTPFHLLDTRWYRTSRALSPRTLLGEHSTQRQQLMHAAKLQDGLLIVAGGTPMKHGYLMADDGWASKTDAALNYPEYDELLSIAQRPILYLSGDIHRNAFGGTLMRNNPAGGGALVSSVIQILASGAGIGAYGPVRFQPSFAQLTITSAADGSGTVVPLLLSLDNGSWLETPRAPTLAFTCTAWNQVYAGESYGEPAYVIDAQPLSCITTRARNKPYQASVKVVRDTLEAFDSGAAAIFSKNLRADALCDAAYIAPVVTPISKTSIIISRLNASLDTASMEAVITNAFDHALRAGKKSVVFFIHGMGKTHAQAIEQAYAIRQLYPQCEPIAFTWAAGAEGGGLFAAIGQFATTLANAKQIGIALRQALTTFNSVGKAYPCLKKVVLARSAGSVALSEAVYSGNVDVINNLDAIVLSAPLLSVSAFNIGSSVFKNAICPAWVTVNTRDSILNRADWANLKIGEVLGNTLPTNKVNPRFRYFDFSHATAVNRLHDYVFTPITHAQAVHAALLSGSDPITPLLATGHIAQSTRADTFQVN